MDIDSNPQPMTRPALLGSSRRKRSKSSTSHDFSRVRQMLIYHGKGIIKLPSIQPHDNAKSSAMKAFPNLPPRETADQLLKQYHACFQIVFPILEWPSFIQQYDVLYRENSFRSVSPTWTGVLFAVFACGALKSSLHEGKIYIDVSRGLIDSWSDNLEIDHAKAAFLSSIFLVETNLSSAGWTSIGHAVRVAQDVGLHWDSGNWTMADDEIRRSLWWSIYVCERYVSLGHKRLLMLLMVIGFCRLKLEDPP